MAEELVLASYFQQSSAVVTSEIVVLFFCSVCVVWCNSKRLNPDLSFHRSCKHLTVLIAFLLKISGVVCGSCTHPDGHVSPMLG